MALSNADRQRRYRERHLGVDGGKDRLQLFISVHANAQLYRLARHYGCTITEAFEKIAGAAEQAMDGSLTPTERKSYYAPL